MRIKTVLNKILNCHCLFAFIIFFPSEILFGQTESIGLFDRHEDVGNPKLKGMLFTVKKIRLICFPALVKISGQTSISFSMSGKK